MKASLCCSIVLALCLPIAILAQDGPTMTKDTIALRAATVSSYHGNFDTWSWVPGIKFRVNGPIASGSQLYVEFANPTGGGTWVKFDCKTGTTEKGHWWKTECGENDIPNEKGITYTGPVKFSIKLRNELQGSDATLFTGTAKVSKAHSNEVGPKFANHYVYYVDQDWSLPIGYVFFLADDVRGMKYPSLAVSMTFRGDPAGVEPHLFHNGKEVGLMNYQGEQVGKATCAHPEAEINTTHYTEEKGPKYSWTRWRCDFPNIHAWNKTGGKIESMFGPLYMLSENPGEYEVKILRGGHLARTMKFNVDPDGHITDNGIAKNFNLGIERIIEPVQVLGDSDGAWNKTAWKTDAFYGNPVPGFTAP